MKKKRNGRRDGNGRRGEEGWLEIGFCFLVIEKEEEIRVDDEEEKKT